MYTILIIALFGLAQSTTTTRQPRPTFVFETTTPPHHWNHRSTHHTQMHHQFHTTPPHGHHAVESNEFDTATFYYDSLSHTMVMHLGTCFLLKLNQHQRELVHSSHGLKAVEYQLMSAFIRGQRTPISHDDVTATSRHLSHMCPNAKNFLLHAPVHHFTTTTIS